MSSLAVSVTETARAVVAARTAAASLHLIVEVGAVVSIWICCELTASALPALSKARYFTVVVEPTEKAPL